MAERDIPSYRADPEWAHVLAVRGVTQNPTVKLVMDQATVNDGLGESLATGRSFSGLSGRVCDASPPGRGSRCHERGCGLRQRESVGPSDSVPGAHDHRFAD